MKLLLLKGDIKLVKQKKIPKATAKRLPLYYRYFNHLYNTGVKRVSSAQLSESMKVDSATIRRDFSYFGALGKRGYGYDVENLMNFFKNQLSQEKLSNIALVGIGKLGQALLHYNFQKDNNIRICAGFDVDKELVGTIRENVSVYHVDDLVDQIKDQQIEVAILTVPTEDAQTITDRLVEGGIKGILNFTPVRVSVPENVRVHNVDLTNELQALIYFVGHYGGSGSDDSLENLAKD